MSERDGEHAGPAPSGGAAIDPVLDEDLSALLDGELDAGRASELTTRVSSDPRLARRLEAFRSVDEGLVALRRGVSPEVVSRLRAGVASAAARPEVPAGRKRRRSRLLRFASPAAALAAGLALYLVVEISRGPSPPDGGPGTETPKPLAAASEEEIGIALELDLLADLEELEQLELLELLASLEGAERS